MWRRWRAARLGSTRLPDYADATEVGRGDSVDAANVQTLACPVLRPDEVLPRLRALGFSELDAQTLADHFLDAERRGRAGHGLARVAWLEALSDLDPGAEPVLVADEPGFERWEGRGALGYLTLAAICKRLATKPPRSAKAIVAADCFPTGMLGYWVRWLAQEAGLVALLTATSPPRLPHPDGGPALVGTTPLAIGVPSPGGDPIIADVSMGKVTFGDVLAGLASPDDLVPFGGEQAHKAFALALGLQLAVEACVIEGYGALLFVIAPETSTVPALRARAAGFHLPGDR